MRPIFRFLILVSCWGTAFQVIAPTDRALAALEDVLYEKGVITKAEWEQIKAEKKTETTRASAQEKGTVSWRGDWIDSVVWAGDIRLRYEQFWRDATPSPVSNGRVRFRLRLRFGPTIDIGDFRIGVRLATGVPDGLSGNQSFQDAFSTKDIGLDRAFVTWTPSFLKQHFTMHGGKMRNFFDKRFTTDLVWDNELNPEGLQQQLKYKVGDTTLYGDFGQFVLDETGDNSFPFQLAWEGGVKGTLMNRYKYQLGVAYYDAVNVKKHSIGEPNPQHGNTRLSGAASSAGGVLVNDYNVLALGGEVVTDVMGLPVKAEFSWVKNLVSPTSCAPGFPNATGQCNPGNAVIRGQDTGYQVGGTIGKAQKARTWDVSYYYKWLQADATLSAFSDSDFGDGGNNRFGHIIQARYQFTDFLQGSVKFFDTKPLVKALCAAGEADCDDIDRVQVNLAWKF